MSRNTIIAIVIVAVLAVGGGTSYALVHKHNNDLAAQKAAHAAMMKKEAEHDAMMKAEADAKAKAKKETTKTSTDSMKGDDDSMMKDDSTDDNVMAH